MRPRPANRGVRSSRYSDDPLEPADHFGRFQPPSRKAFIIIILLIIVFTLGLSNSLAVLSMDDDTTPEDPDDSGLLTISGVVINKNTGDSLSGVAVRIAGTNLSGITNTDGWYTIPDVQSGEQEIRASKNGYKTIIKTVDLSPDDMPNVDFELVPGEGEVNEVIDNDPTDQNNNDWRKPSAALFALFAFIAAPAIFLIINRKAFWLACLCITISLLSYGFLFGTLAGIIALGLLISMKDEFKAKQLTPEPGRDTFGISERGGRRPFEQRAHRRPIRGGPSRVGGSSLPPPPPPRRGVGNIPPPPPPPRRRGRAIPPPPPPPRDSEMKSAGSRKRRPPGRTGNGRGSSAEFEIYD